MSAILIVVAFTRNASLYSIVSAAPCNVNIPSHAVLALLSGRHHRGAIVPALAQPEVIHYHPRNLIRCRGHHEA
jgi:hypothetical protein